MTTADGRLVMPSNMGVPSPHDLATSLGRVPRFVGHTRRWWVVLHHVLLCYHTARRAGILTPELAPHLLLHDSEEAIAGDTPSPWKSAAQKRLGVRLHRRITRAYLGQDLLKGPAAATLKGVDVAVLRLECARVGPRNTEHHSGLRYVPDEVAELAVPAGLAYSQVSVLQHDPHEPAASDMGRAWLALLEQHVPPDRWRILSEKAG